MNSQFVDYRQKFKDIREDKDLLQKDIAEICNVSDATVGHWETKKRNMQIDDIVKLCKYYKISADWFLGLTNENLEKSPYERREKI